MRCAMGLALSVLLATVVCVEGEPVSTATMHLVNALLSQRVMPSLNLDMAWRVKKDKLDPATTVVKKPIVQFHNMTGLSTLKIDKIEATSITSSSPGYLAKINVTASLGSNLLATGSVGKAPHNIPVNLTVGQVLLKSGDIHAIVDMNTFSVVQLKVMSLDITYGSVTVVSAVPTFSAMLENVEPSYKRDIQEWVSKKARKPVEAGLRKMLPISLLEYSEPEAASATMPILP